MEKRKRSVSLSFLILRSGLTMLAGMCGCAAVWLAAVSLMEAKGVVYAGYVSNQQVEQLIAESPKRFSEPGDDFLAEYVWLDKSGNPTSSNLNEKQQKALLAQMDSKDVHILKHPYPDGSCAVFRWNYRKEFADPQLRNTLPPFEYLWWAALGLGCVLCWLLNALWLRRRLVSKLKLFQTVSDKVGAQELDFKIPYAGIKEFDQALGAMERMRRALYCSLTSQWAAQQGRAEEIAALAHDLKTPLTLIGGNAELLMEEDLPEGCCEMVKAILSGNRRAKQYVASLMDTANGEDETFEIAALEELFEELCQNAKALAGTKNIRLHTENSLSGIARMQKQRLLRAAGNVVQNAIEHTPEDGLVEVKGAMTEEGWQIEVRDGGPGFSKAALLHAAERLWRGDSAREANGHNGLGLWFAAQVVQKHGGKIQLSNQSSGGVVVLRFARSTET